MSSTRLNPTSNGLMHLGHAYLAFLNEHIAHSTGGKFVLRIENNQFSWVRDLGQAKCDEYADAWVEDVEWLGLHPDQIVYESELEDVIGKTIRRKHPNWYDDGVGVLTEAQVIGMNHVYPMAKYLTAKVALLDAMQGVDLLICGMDLITRDCFYAYVCQEYDLPEIKRVYVPRLTGDMLDDVSKTRGNMKIRGYRERGWSRQEVEALLRDACLVDRDAEWTINNIKTQPKLEVEYA
jgi:glutamyl/glutaminyl-tRNA synthetase